MKKVITFIMILSLLVCIFGGVCSYAGEEVGADAVVESTESTPDEQSPDIWARLREYIDSGKLYEALGLVASFVLVIIAGYLKRAMGALGAKMLNITKAGSDKLGESADNMKAAAEGNAEALKVLAAELQNKFDTATQENRKELQSFAQNIMQKFEELCSKFEVQTVTHEQVENIGAELRDLAEMVDMVYEGSSTIPAAVKERVAARYNHIVSIAEKETQAVITNEQ